VNILEGENGLQLHSVIKNTDEKNFLFACLRIIPFEPFWLVFDKDAFQVVTSMERNGHKLTNFLSAVGNQMPI